MKTVRGTADMVAARVGFQNYSIIIVFPKTIALGILSTWAQMRHTSNSPNEDKETQC